MCGVMLISMKKNVCCINRVLKAVDVKKCTKREYYKNEDKRDIAKCT